MNFTHQSIAGSCVHASRFMPVVCFFFSAEYVAKCFMRCQNWRLHTTFCNFIPILHVFCVEKIKVSSCHCIRCTSPRYTYKCYFPPHGRDLGHICCNSAYRHGVDGVKNHAALESSKRTGGHHPRRDKVHRFRWDNI